MMDERSVLISRQPQLCDHTASFSECSLAQIVKFVPRAGRRRTWRPAIRGSAHQQGGELAVKSVNSHGVSNSMRDVDEP
jgi:hypothetical protein